MSDTVFNRGKLIQLIIGASGVYFCYLVSALLQQSLIKSPYINIQTQKEQFFKYPIFFMILPHCFTYLSGVVYNYFQLSPKDRVKIPNKNSASCAFLALLGGITFNYAILYTNYPIVVTVKSCNLLSVILVGVLCSRVKDSKVKLSTKKILIGVIASLGIILFTYFDPAKKNDDQKKFQIIGFVVLFISLLADGFLPDLQAEIKTKFEPKPTQMMVEINKWITIFSLAYAVCLNEVVVGIHFMLEHEWFFLHLLVLGLLNCCGQFFVYRMIKQFKQHIVPFVITTRKIFTVVISILFYNHPTSYGQICGVVLVFGVVIYEFISEVYQKKQSTAVPSNSPKRIDQMEEKQILDQSIQSTR